MKIKIYQINNKRDFQGVKFQSIDHLERLQGTKNINAEIYDEVFSGDLPCKDLEDVFVLFNRGVGHPLMRGHSLSVSDVVVKEDGAYFCDSTVFERVDFDESKTQKPDNLLTVVYVEPNKFPYVAEIENTIEGMQRAVGGNIQCVNNDDKTLIVCNDEGKLEGLAPNRMLGLDDILVGNFFVAGSAGEEMRSLTEEEQSKYIEKYGEESMDEVAGFVIYALLQMKQ